jgi:hypothetical protein
MWTILGSSLTGRYLCCSRFRQQLLPVLAARQCYAHLPAFAALSVGLQPPSWCISDASLQVPDTDDVLLVDTFAPQLSHLLDLAVSYSQQATRPEAAAAASAAGSSSWPLHHLTAGAGSGWWGSSLTGPPSGTAQYMSLSAWRPLSPTRQGRYQRCFMQHDVSAQHPSVPDSCSAGPDASWAVRAGHGATTPSNGFKQVPQAAAGCQQLRHVVAAVLLQAVLVLISQPR